MNRTQEHYALLEELQYTPPALDDAYVRALSRLKKRNTIRNRIIVPIGAIMSIFIIFVAMVNVSPAIASAMERIPGLRQLAAAVSFSPTLQTAVEHDYAQPVNLTQTINDITMSIEHVIVDQRQLHIFYTLDSQIYFNMRTSVDLQGVQWDFLSSPQNVSGNGVVRQLTIGFEEQIPDDIVLEAGVFDYGAADQDAGIAEPSPEELARFVFRLELDTAFTQQGEIITLDYDLAIDGQLLTITTVEINPTNMSVRFSADDNNTAWLRTVEFYFEDENGQRFYPPTGAAVANLLAEDSPMLETHYLESAFFAGSESLTMFIDQVEWLDKDMENIRVDLVSGTSDRFPDYISLENVEKADNGWVLSFSVLEDGERRLRQITYEKIPLPDRVAELSGISYEWEIRYSENEQLFFSGNPPLAEYNDEILYLTPWYSRIERLETPIKIRVK
jgi:hypothetical protein